MKRKLIGDRAFYKMVLTVAVPIMVQNGITNFVGLLDNIMVGRIGTEQMSGCLILPFLVPFPELEFSEPSSLAVRIRRE